MAKRVLVKFENGTFGVCVKGFLLGDRFVDLRNFTQTWSIPEYVVDYCQGNEATARKALADPTRYEVVE